MIKYLFIDGACLNQVIKKHISIYCNGSEGIQLDWKQIKNTSRKVFYYDAIPVQINGEDDNSYSIRTLPKRQELAHIEQQDSFHVKTGDVRKRKTRGSEQKMVDVQLAVDTLLMASRGLFSSATLLTGDLDFKPLINALVDMGVDVELIYPLNETNEELKSAADRSFPLTPSRINHMIKDGSSCKNSLPTVEIQRDIEHNAEEKQILYWQDPIYQSCYIYFQETYSLITHNCPAPHSYSKMRIRSRSKEALCKFAKDEFGIVIPAF